MKSTPAENSGVLVLHKTLDILEAIKSQPAGVKLSDLSRAVGMPKATVYRILATLESRGFLDRNEDGATAWRASFLICSSPSASKRS